MASITPWSPAPEPPAQLESGAPFEATAPALASTDKSAKRSFIKRRLGPLLAAIVALLTKLKTIILLLPKAKLLVTIGTMLVSLAAYAWIWGWTFAAGFVVLLFLHEMGHVIQLRREGIKASAPMFVPFLGALITARSLGDSAVAEARVGLAGPILGSIASAACILIWHATGSDLWRALAFTGFFLNLFNLLPVVPLDGGRAMAAMAPWMWFLGLAAMLPLVFLFPNPLIVVIIVLAGLETHRRWKRRRAGGDEQEAYYRVKPLDRALVAGVYLALIGLLVIGMHATALTRTFG
ncbi:MAG: site-2 protease family protein [Solirubrobacterales bacterium]|nr:site-2 protease family protein [Solirubrobacterales bacterium]MBV9798406.1 site-2 protease family protein [Solirubrobacterales bacterium]